MVFHTEWISGSLFEWDFFLQYFSRLLQLTYLFISVELLFHLQNSASPHACLVFFCICMETLVCAQTIVAVSVCIFVDASLWMSA